MSAILWLIITILGFGGTGANAPTEPPGEPIGTITQEINPSNAPIGPADVNGESYLFTTPEEYEAWRSTLNRYLGDAVDEALDPDFDSTVIVVHPTMWCTQSTELRYVADEHLLVYVVTPGPPDTVCGAAPGIRVHTVRADELAGPPDTLTLEQISG